MMAELPEHAQRNRAEWDTWADSYARVAPGAWRQEEITWGQLHIAEAAVHALPESVAGLDVIELGCGTAYFSAWLARRGARPVGIDNSPRQLETARRMQQEFGVEFPLHLGNAETLAFPDASFDLALSEYGASIWCDPYAWIPEAARVLRPGGRLVFLVNSLLATLCTPADALIDTPISEALRQPQFGLHRIEWPDDTSVEFHLPHGEMIRLLRECGFVIEQLLELSAPDGSEDQPPLIPTIPNTWSRQWPAEEIWCVRKQP